MQKYDAFQSLQNSYHDNVLNAKEENNMRTLSQISGNKPWQQISMKRWRNSDTMFTLHEYAWLQVLESWKISAVLLQSLATKNELYLVNFSS